jgi:hypothetical protein
VESLDDDSFTVAPAITSIDVVDVVSDLQSLPEATQPADMGPNGFVDSAEAASVEFVDAVPGMTPVCADAASIEVAPTLVLMEKIAATPSATITATAEPNVQVVTEIITAAPAIGPTADTVTTGALPTTPKKVKNPRRKPENEGLGSAGKVKKARKKSVKGVGASGTPDLTASDGAHSP